MPNDESWKAIVASALDWGEAHLTLDKALKDLPANLRGRRPEGLPHSPWDLVEHLRIAQHDLLDFIQNPDYSEDLKWPDDYWPPPCEVINDEMWENSLSEIRCERDELKKFTTEPDATSLPKFRMARVRLICERYSSQSITPHIISESSLQCAGHSAPGRRISVAGLERVQLYPARHSRPVAHSRQRIRRSRSRARYQQAIATARDKWRDRELGPHRKL
jgi:hypothetical protein